MFKRILLAGFLAGALTATTHAQTHTLDGVAQVGHSAISPIYAGNEVKGYIMYSKGDKADRKNDNYLLDFYDQDLAKVTSVTIQKPSGRYFLLGNSFNGSAFALYFLNLKEQALEIETYDTGLKKLGTKTFGDLSRADKMMVQQAVQQGGTGSNDSAFGGLELVAVPGYGFIRNSFEGMGKGYTIEMLDNQLNTKWTAASEPKSKFYEAINVGEATDKYVLATIMRRSGMLSRKIDSYMVAYDAATGKKVLEAPVETGVGEQLSLSSFTFDAAKREFVAVGEYYLPDDKPFVSKSQGFFIKRFSETGQPVMTKNYGWQKEVKAALPAAALPSIDEGFVNCTQTIVRAANGRLYLVAEQYKIVADGLGIAGSLMGSRVATTKGRIANLLVFALDPTYNLTEIKFYPKDESRAVVPNGAGFAGAGLLGQYFKSSGQFDYQFMQKNDANTKFNAVYINYDKEKGEATKKIIGNIAFDDKGQFKLDKIDGTSDATVSYLYPAKPGYLMVLDYLKKQKKATMKLVKLNI